MLLSMFSNKDRYKVNIQKSIPPLNTGNKKAQNIMEGKIITILAAQQKITRNNINQKHPRKTYAVQEGIMKPSRTPRTLEEMQGHLR